MQPARFESSRFPRPSLQARHTSLDAKSLPFLVVAGSLILFQVRV
jgi:hypothetical protein